MTKTPTPSEAAAAVLRNATLPPGDDERFVGYGVMGLPFRSGHYLALRDFPATSFSPAYPLGADYQAYRRSVPMLLPRIAVPHPATADTPPAGSATRR